MNNTANITTVLNNMIGGDINEYMSTALIIAAAFIAIAGVVITLGHRSQRFSGIYKTLLIFSILFGAVSMSTILKWYDNGTLLWFAVDKDIVKLVVGTSLFAQFFLWFYPLISLFPAIPRIKKENNEIQGETPKQSIINGEMKEVTLSEIKNIIINSKEEMINLYNKSTFRHSLTIGLFASGVSLLGVGGISFFSGFRLPGGLGDLSKEYLIVSLAELLIGLVLIILSWSMLKKKN